MSDDRDDEYKQGKRWDERRGWYDSRERPTVVTVFGQLGYNLWNQDDINRLRENLEFAQKTREREETMRSRRLGWFVSAAIAILSTIATVFGEWIVSKVVR
jgi:hypothetical protein